MKNILEPDGFETSRDEAPVTEEAPKPVATEKKTSFTERYFRYYLRNSGLYYALLIVGFCSTYWLIGYFFIFENTLSVKEIRYYVFLVFLFLAAIVFGVLRLYNALVANSSFLLKFRDAVATSNKAMSKFTDGMLQASRSITQGIKKFGDGK